MLEKITLTKETAITSWNGLKEENLIEQCGDQARCNEIVKLVFEFIDEV